jgi:cytochrome c oxidase subunit 2
MNEQNFQSLSRMCVVASLLVLGACGDEAPTQSQAQSPAERGLALANANACLACHAVDDRRGVGPGWLGIYGTTRKLKDGSSVVVDDAYLRRSMLEPSAQIVEGYDDVMITAAVNEEQIADIIAFIKELGTSGTQ